MPKHVTPGALAGATGGVGRCFAEREHPSDSAPGTAPQPFSLRPYQSEAIESIEADPHRRVIVVAPTGSGKTVIAAELIRQARARGQRCLFVDHRREITEQTCRKLWALGLDHGVIQAGFPARPAEPVQVASIQTLHARAIRGSAIDMPPADLVIIDEAHHCRAQTWQRLIEAYPKARIIGLTATPVRSDGRGLGNIFETLIEVSTVSELIALKYLVRPKVYAPVRPDLTGIRVRRGDYVESELAERVNTDRLVGDIVEHWLKLNPGRRRTVVYAVNVAHSLHIRDDFRRAGVMAEHIDGSTPIDERDRILALLAAGNIEVVTNCQILTEGWDCPELGCIVLARPTKSLGLYRQMTGRGLRPAPNKNDVLVLGHSGAVFQHGFIDDPIQWALEEDRRAENTAHNRRRQHGGKPGLTTCPECRAVRMGGQPCLSCGWRPRAKPRHVAIADGELGFVNRDRSVTGVSGVSALDFYRMLLHIAREKGRRDGWAWHKTREKFGVEIRGRHQPIPPSPHVRAWARSRDIAFAKARQAQRPDAR